MTHRPAFAPGTSWGYSNTNYYLAGMIVERITGRPLADEISRRITRPLGLTRTYLPDRGTVIPGPHPRHYSKLHRDTVPDAKVYDVADMDQSTSWAAGGMVSSAEDMNRFFSALLGGRLLPPAQQREMFTTVPSKDYIPGVTGYGLGVLSQKLPCGRTVWGNGGATWGSWSYTMGTRDGRHMLAQNINADWIPAHIGVFPDVLQAEFCRK
ncbi:serine-type D-alanyl-D-alanine carboxypeptidase [Streptomyces sp. NBRC 110611]|nr:serine-type D-alanyl-D-alanine carboxypeptidase [Streptomyces sp. NBRC 110611]